MIPISPEQLQRREKYQIEADDHDWTHFIYLAWFTKLAILIAAVIAYRWLPGTRGLVFAVTPVAIVVTASVTSYFSYKRRVAMKQWKAHHELTKELGSEPASQFAIEPATSDDFDKIAELNVAAYEEFAPRLQPGSWEVMQNNLRNVAERARSVEFLVCREDEEILGAVAYCPAGKGDPSIFKPDMASVQLLAVHPLYRGRGLAKALTAACISRARRDGANSIGLFTSELMEAAQHIYTSLGFQLDSELPVRYGVRYVRYVLSLAAT